MTFTFFTNGFFSWGVDALAAVVRRGRLGVVGRFVFKGLAVVGFEGLAVRFVVLEGLAGVGFFVFGGPFVFFTLAVFSMLAFIASAMSRQTRHFKKSKHACDQRVWAKNLTPKNCGGDTVTLGL